MKTNSSARSFCILGLAFVLVSAIPQVRGGNEENSVYATSPQDGELPGCHDPEHWERDPGGTGSFVLHMVPGMLPGGAYVNFSVSGTAIAGVDYVPHLLSCVHRTLRLRRNPDPNVA